MQDQDEGTGALQNLEMAEQFLDQFRPGGPWVITAIPSEGGDTSTGTFHRDSGADIQDLKDRIAARNNAINHYNIYFTVNRTIGTMSKKPKKEDIGVAEYLHVDIDNCPDRETALEKLRGLPPFTFLIFSGGGFQAFWRLAAPMDVTDEHNRRLVEKYNRAIAHRCDGDPACWNIDRVMRLPGTCNHPNARKRARGRVPVGAMVAGINLHSRVDFRDFTFTEQELDDPAGDTVENGHGGEGDVVPVTLDMMQRYNVSGELEHVIIEGERRDGTTTVTRSEAVFYVSCCMARLSVPILLTAGLFVNREYKISESILEKRNWKRVAYRQAERGHRFVNMADYIRKVNA